MRLKWLIYFVACSLSTVVAGAVLSLIAGAAAHTVPAAQHWLSHLTMEPLGPGYLAITMLFAVLAVLAGVPVAVWLGLSFTSQTREHLRSIIWGAEGLTRGDLSIRLPESEDGELQAISEAFNQMARRLEVQVQTLQAMAEENATLTNEASEKAALEERRRLASDLHDAVAQLLFAINMSVSAAVKLLDKKPSAAKEQMEYVQDMAVRAQAEMRALLMHLRPVSLGERSLKAAAEDLLREVQQRSGINFEVSLSDIRLSRAVEDNLFRIMQEAVANSMKHASASTIRVQLTHASGRVLLSVEDDGVGMPVDPQKQTSYGLKTMEERANKLGGSVSWLSMPGRGTRVEVRVRLSGAPVEMEG